MERDGCCQSTHSYNADFNSHAHVERYVNPAERVKIYFNFNSHAHVERDVSYNRKQYLNKDFNSHAHVERDNEPPKKSNNRYISTHTLTWSVTF